MRFDRIPLLLLSSLVPAVLAGFVPSTEKFKLDSNRTKRHIKWLAPSRSLLVRLETPNLPLWNAAEQIGERKPSNFILEIALSHDNRTLLVQGQAYFPLPNPHVPPRLYAPQTNLSHERFHSRESLDLFNRPSFGLDYTRLVRPRDDWGISYTRYTPEVTLDLIGAGIEGHNALLPSHKQWTIMLKLKDHNFQTSNPPKHNFTILEAWLQKRDGHYHFPDVTTVMPCSLWSWRCEETMAAPWYRNILRRDFDEWGKIGCLRREIFKRWSSIKGFLRSDLMILVLVLVAILTAIPSLRSFLYDAAVYVKEYVEVIWRGGWRAITQHEADTQPENAYFMVEEGEEEEEEEEVDSDDSLPSAHEKGLDERPSW